MSELVFPSLAPQTTDSERILLAKLLTVTATAARPLSDYELMDNALGSTVVAETPYAPRWAASVPISLFAGFIRMTALFIGRRVTVNGIVIAMRTAGVYVAGSGNFLCLYKQAGNVAQFIDATPDDPSMYQGTGYVEKALTIPYVAEPGLYYAGISHDATSQTTAPQFAGTNQGIAFLNRPPGASFSSAVNLAGTTPPATFPITGAPPSSVTAWMGLTGIVLP